MDPDYRQFETVNLFGQFMKKSCIDIIESSILNDYYYTIATFVYINAICSIGMSK